jgi:hypothetical protein
LAVEGVAILPSPKYTTHALDALSASVDDDQ